MVGPAVASRPLKKPSVIKSWLRAIELTSGIEANARRLFADVIEDRAAMQPDRLALISDAQTYSYQALRERINRYARWALSAGIEVGDTVCLLMPSRPEYLAAWLGISKVGGVVALINTKLIGTSLSHSIKIANAKHVIVSTELAEMFASGGSHLDRGPKVWFYGGGANQTRIDIALASLDGSNLSQAERRDVTIDHRALLIYTSGTTGLPKAASISHRRILNWAHWFAGLTHATPEDRMYNCLPVYHSVGGIVAPCSLLSAGGSVVLAERFSPSDFWNDIVRWNCTVFQYIGELCRYLLKAAPVPNEMRHGLRLGCGNGLRGDIWNAFEARFKIPQILEFYAATEGNFSLYNVEGKPGAIGRIPPFLAHRVPVAIVRFDSDRGIPLRGADGLCIRCASGEPGELIGRIGNGHENGSRFEGYTDAGETEEKILRDAFSAGDAWFRTGDLMMRDNEGYFHFIDRLGDTFRWKGENVAASEVNQAVGDCPGVVDASTYGVEIPGADGRAGMIAIVVDNRFDLADLNDRLSRRLPAYACPVFVRIRASLDLTETFKQKKNDLIREGFDPGVISDPLFFRDRNSGTYQPIDAAAYAGLSDGSIRV